ncbi:hypothetical protein [Pontibacillus salicampi]
MKEDIQSQYNIMLGREWKYFGYRSFDTQEGPVTIVPGHHLTEEEALEQRSLCEFLHANQWTYSTFPLFTKNGDMKATINGRDYMLVRTGMTLPKDSAHGTLLAQYHHLGSQYPYQPQHISRYGQWKALWEEKIDAWTNVYKREWGAHPASSFQRLFIETYPYLEGVMENAIQYLQESEQDWRYGEYDQGAFTAQRLLPKNLQQTIWSHTMVYDHPARDIAEWIRATLFEKQENGFQEVRTFMEGYEQQRPLSAFGWRLVYARLILPVHLLDQLDYCFHQDQVPNNRAEYMLKQELTNQVVYYRLLQRFFDEVQLDAKRLHIPVLDW